jgi:hypothetical protein
LRCGVYSSAVSNVYLRKRFHPDWQAKKIGQKQGKNVDTFGSEPRAVMNALREDGSLFYDFSNVHLDTDGVAKCGDCNSYPDTLDWKAKANRISGYLGVDGAPGQKSRSALSRDKQPRTCTGGRRGSEACAFARLPDPRAKVGACCAQCTLGRRSPARAG